MYAFTYFFKDTQQTWPLDSRRLRFCSRLYIKIKIKNQKLQIVDLLKT